MRQRVRQRERERERDREKEKQRERKGERKEEIESTRVIEKNKKKVEGKYDLRTSEYQLRV